jgi:chemotaxis protein MotB
MRSDLPPKPRVIVKKGHGRAHGGAWKVAYADFVTTMMALFVVLWIVGQNVDTREAVAQYFKDPGSFHHLGTPSMLPGRAGLLSGEPAAPMEPSLPEPEPERDPVKEERALQRAAATFTQAVEHLGRVDMLKDQVTVEMTPEGLRIELREREGAPFFRVGSAAVVPEMKPVIETVARAVAALPNHITVEGHTDSRQYSNRDGYSNWELSTDRTNSARRIMEAAGLPRGRIDRLVGHADRLPLFPNDRLNPLNRRITVIVRRAAG